MKVILLKDVKGTGKKGDRVHEVQAARTGKLSPGDRFTLFFRRDIALY